MIFAYNSKTGTKNEKTCFQYLKSRKFNHELIAGTYNNKFHNFLKSSLIMYPFEGELIQKYVFISI